MFPVQLRLSIIERIRSTESQQPIRSRNNQPTVIFAFDIVPGREYIEDVITCSYISNSKLGDS